MLVILWTQEGALFPGDFVGIQSIHWNSRFQKLPKTLVLLIFFHKKPSEKRTYVFTGYSIKNGLWNSMWKAPMPCGLSAIFRLLANLVPFWRLVTCQLTILHYYVPAHTRCTTWLPVQHDIQCSRKFVLLDNCIMMCNKVYTYMSL